MKKYKIFLIAVLLLLAFSFLAGCESGYKVTFNSQGGSNVPTQEIGEGGKATEPDAPTRKNYIFGGWFTSQECNDKEKFSFNTVITNDLILYAKWIEEFAVTFNSQGGSDIAIQKIEKGEKITKPNPPQKAGFIFAGWWTDQDCTEGNEYDFEKPVNADVTIYAKWLAETSASSFEFELTDDESGYILKTFIGDESEVVIPSNYNGKPVMCIGGYAFYNCFGIVSVIIPSGVNRISGDAFENCTSLTTITIPNSIKSIGDTAFYNCKSLTSIIIPDEVTVIEAYTFFKCINLTKVSLGNNIVSIGWGAFANCENLTDITIPNSVTSIGDYAFAICSNLITITIPDSVQSIGDYAFAYCSNLTSITIPNSVMSIGDSAFYGGEIPHIVFCEADSQPAGWNKYWYGHEYNFVYWAGEWAKQADENFYSPDGKTLLKYVGSEANLTVPSGVTSIGKGAFLHCLNLTSITVPDSVTSIEDYAFAICLNLTSITVPDSVTSIGQGVFQSCSKLESITLPFVGNTKGGTENTHFGYVFGANDYSQNNFSIPSSLKTVIITGGNNIANMAFRNCSYLTSITIGNNVTSIGEVAFYECSNLTSITVGNSVQSIGDSAFSDCAELASIAVATNNQYYKSIDGNLYTKDGKILIQYAVGKTATSFTIPDNVISIGGSAFDGCSNLTTISIPDSVQSIGNYAFYGCESLTSVTIGNGVQSIGEGAFAGCSSLTAITIPDSVTSIGQGAFADCSKLIIFCKAASEPLDWSSYWNYNSLQVYWAGEWSLVNGVPTPNK